MNPAAQPSAKDGVRAGGFSDVEKLLRERTFIHHDADDYLPADAMAEPATFHCNGQRYYHSKLDIAAADAIQSLEIALASQIEITNTERGHAERCAQKLATTGAGLVDAGRIADAIIKAPFGTEGTTIAEMILDKVSWNTLRPSFVAAIEAAIGREEGK